MFVYFHSITEWSKVSDVSLMFSNPLSYITCLANIELQVTPFTFNFINDVSTITTEVSIKFKVNNTIVCIKINIISLQEVRAGAAVAFATLETTMGQDGGG